jgi:hypothetical protein
MCCDNNSRLTELEWIHNFTSDITYTVYTGYHQRTSDNRLTSPATHHSTMRLCTQHHPTACHPSRRQPARNPTSPGPAVHNSPQPGPPTAPMSRLSATALLVILSTTQSTCSSTKHGPISAFAPSFSQGLQSPKSATNYLSSFSLMHNNPVSRPCSGLM